jgi:5'-nucleotidase
MRLFGAAGVALALLVAGCSSSSSDSTSSGGGTSETTATTMAAEPIRILVTNDDGYSSDGIDAVVQALREVPDVEVTVVAPLANQSGKGGSVTGGTLTATDVTTKSGYKAKAVDGTPADSIIWAIEQKGIDFTPDLVISGVNAGQNMGPTVSISGTVGAARAAALRGIPALAASQGPLLPPQDFPAAVAQVIDWLNENMPAIKAGTLTTETIANINAPTCATGSVRGSIEVPVATTNDGYNDTPNCASTVTDPTADIQAYLDGFAPLSQLSTTQGATS